MTNMIAGEIGQEGPLTFASVNPRTRTAGKLSYYNASIEEIDRAVRAAVEAFKSTKNYPPEKLAGFLERIAQEIEALGDHALDVADMETALGIPRLASERARTTGQLRAFSTLLREGSYVEAIIDTALPDRQPAPRPDIRRMLFPIGPVAVFSASNFPFAFSVAGGDTASALAAGCPVIVKGHPGHPATSELFAQAVNRAVAAEGFPVGFFSLLQGDRPEVGQALVQHPGIEAVAFTGSLRAGRAIFDAAARRPRPIPVYAEMGSVNPVVVLPGAIEARGDAIAEGLVNSVTLGSGQFCTNPGLVFVQDSSNARQFVERVRQIMSERDSGILLNANVERGLAQTVSHTTQRPAVQVLTGGHVVEGSGYCYPNTLLQTDSAAFRADSALQTEHFGPVTLFVMCQTTEDLQAALLTLEGNLTATIHAELDEIESAAALYDILRERAGRLIWNGYPTGVEVVYAMQHGGPYPATTAPNTTSVGMTAIRRFMRPVAYQNVPDELLPPALKRANPKNIWRIVNGQLTRDPA